jgi:hypothetical protein
MFRFFVLGVRAYVEGAVQACQCEFLVEYQWHLRKRGDRDECRLIDCAQAFCGASPGSQRARGLGRVAPLDCPLFTTTVRTERRVW